MSITDVVLKRVGQSVTRTLGLSIQENVNSYYFPEAWWGNGVTEEGGQRKGVYTDAFWLAPPYGRPRDIDYNRLEPLEKSVWVRMCVQHVVDSIAGAAYNIVPLKYGDDVDEKLLQEAKDFFLGAKWGTSWSQCLRECLPELLNYDCGVITKIFPVKAYDKDGNLKENVRPLELVSIDGRSVLKDVGLFKNLQGYWQYSWINPQGIPVHFEVDELIYLQQAPSTREPYGTSNLEVIESVLDYMVDSTLAQSKYWKNGLFIGGQIDLPEVTDITELKRMQAYYEAKLRGPNKYNKWIVTGGGAKVQSMPFTSQEMQWLDSQKWFAKMVFAVYKLTPSELGFTEDLNRATGIQQMQIHKSKGIRPILLILEEAINREIIWKHFSPTIRFEFNKELDLDEEAKQTTIDTQRLTAGLDSINELRDRDGKPKWEDEKFNLPFATPTDPNAPGRGEPDLSGMSDEDQQWAQLFGGTEGDSSNDTGLNEEDIDDATDANKAASVEAASGEPGYVPMPQSYDGPMKPLNLKKEEEDSIEMINRLIRNMKKDYTTSVEDFFGGKNE